MKEKGFHLYLGIVNYKVLLYELLKQNEPEMVSMCAGSCGKYEKFL